MEDTIHEQEAAPNNSGVENKITNDTAVQNSNLNWKERRKMYNTLQEKWSDFMHRVIPEFAPRIQIETMKDAFYAGATSALFLMNSFSAEGIDEDTGAAMLSTLFDEVESYAAKRGNPK